MPPAPKLPWETGSSGRLRWHEPGMKVSAVDRLSSTITWMRITVRFFAILKDRTGCPEARLEMPDGSTVGAATDAISKVFPAIREDLKRCAMAINREYAKLD